MKKLAENQIIGLKHIYDSDTYAKFSENNDDIAVEICGKRGINLLQEHFKNGRLDAME